ncbi:tripartite motif-containing protein 16-like [Alosa alosa]|uniref:tripartite motif-containing protein 16-like n=1 Tax=Alosa alosa TaxID=278164 RepID=UPI002015538E|nr:tripartite motif-containing protein 16-like [Alosa alosa]
MIIKAMTQCQPLLGERRNMTHLGETQKNFKQRILEKEKEMLELRKAVETLKSSAETAVEDSERIFTEMICSIERRRSEVTELIRAQEKAEVSRAEGLLKQLEQEIAELKRRDAELEQLSHTEDHIYFLKTFQSISDPPESTGVLPHVSVNQNVSFEAAKKSVSSLKEQLETFWTEEFMKISAAVTGVQAILQTEPTTREGFLQYSCHFTLDSNTANGKGGWRRELSSSHILIIQRDFIRDLRCCVERVCLDAATGRLSGVSMCL